ncbi:MAG: DUF1385 domain-containing protein [Thermoanaerobacteraceae bacterium]|nr:DUF1385 domain-containing protein [Thermoanaerobacteraceae bacterium]
MRKTMIGGQAVIEGVMMRGKSNVAIAVRNKEGISLDRKKVSAFSDRYPIFKLPFLRGIVSLVESLIMGVNAITYSAEMAGELVDDEPTKFDNFLDKLFGDKLDNVLMAFSLVISLGFAVLLFFILPTWSANLVKKFTESGFLLNIVEGIIRVAIFLIYLVAISSMKDIRRVFEYHGAEHKTIHCYEHEEELTAENARKYTTLHPRCGTNFLFLVMVVSILLFSLFSWPDFWTRVVLRIVLLPVVAGISYELIRWAGKSNSLLARAVAYPGMMLQKLTTREPDDSQLEVAIASLKAILEVEGDNDIIP